MPQGTTIHAQLQPSTTGIQVPITICSDGWALGVRCQGLDLNSVHWTLEH